MSVSSQPPKVVVPLHRCRNYPRWEIRGTKWVLYCENCGEVVS